MLTYRRVRLGKIGADTVVDFAVAELTRYLKKMDSQLVVDVLQTKRVEETFSQIIWVGVDPALSAFMPQVEDPRQDDAFGIDVQDSNGYITGTNPRSVLIGAYRFLKALGCDWVRPGRAGERIPNKEITGICVQLREAASYRHRGVCIEGADTYDNVLDMVDFLPKIGMNAYFLEFLTPMAFFKRWYGHKSNPYLEAEPIDSHIVTAMVAALEGEMAKRGIIYHKVGHGWTCEPFGIDGSGWNSDRNRVYEMTEQTRSYLAQLDGVRALYHNDPLCTNLCYSNPVVRSTITNAIVSYCKDNPQVNMLHFWLADAGNNHCECDACKAKRPADWYIIMLNELDQALSAAGLDTKVVFLLYMDLLWEPLEESLANPERFILMYAPITRKYGENYSDHTSYDRELSDYTRNSLEMPSSLGENLAYLRQWQTHFKGDSFIYDYHLMWAHLNDPGYEACARNLFEDMRSLREIGLNGMNSCQVQRCFFPSALPMQMMAAVLWDRDCDYETRAEAYYLSAFGPDGLEARKYLREISEKFHMYHGASHGNGAKIDGPLCCGYEDISQCVREAREIIDCHAAEESPWQEEWKLLQYHTDYVLALAQAADLTDREVYEEAKQVLTQLVDQMNRNELFLQPAMDCFNAKKHWLRRLDPQKCRQSMDV
jgi:hypothetical protein